MMEFHGISPFNRVPRRRGQPDSVPRISWMPRICEKRMPTVTPNWLTVPKPPRKFNGAISEMYMGTSDVFNPVGRAAYHPNKHNQHFPQLLMVDLPQLNPMMSLPMMSISYDSADLDEPIKMAPNMPVMLFINNPRFLFDGWMDGRID